MVNGLPSMPYTDGIKKHTLNKFGGYNHTLAADDGDLYDMCNMSSDFYPLLAPRVPRYHYSDLNISAFTFVNGELYYVVGTGFYRQDTVAALGTVTEGKKQFTTIGSKLIIMPDKKYYDTATNIFGSLEAYFTGDVTFTDGTFAGQPAERCCITSTSKSFPFKVGDAVMVSDCTIVANNITAIIREIHDDGKTLVFYENTWIKGKAENVSLARTMPDLEYLCENENRLWGCTGQTIYACKLGDPTNWQVYDGLATDSFAVDVGSGGPFTGCISYLGYPCFFKEDVIYKIYGTTPANFKMMGSASSGVAYGSDRSLSIVGDLLFYLAPAGITAYTGGVPSSVAAPFGLERYKNAVGGSDGVKYYIAMEDMSGVHHLFVYDTRHSVWHKEDDLKAVMMGYNDGLWALADDGVLWLLGHPTAVPSWLNGEGSIDSMAEFADFVENNPNKKGIAKIQLRLDLAQGATVSVYLKFAGANSWELVSTLTTETKRSYYLPIIPRRSDHYRIKLEGNGMWQLYSLTRESYLGSEL